MFAGKYSISLLSNLYLEHILTLSNPLSTSSFVITSLVTSDIIHECFTTTRSSHPQRLGLLVVVPYSLPFFWRYSPALFKSSVGRGPSPTLVVYAFTIPIISSIFLGPIPVPILLPPAIVFDDVVKGYVPKSTSSIVPCAPSKRIFLPDFIALFSSI